MHTKRRDKLLATTPLGRAVLGIAGHGPDTAELATFDWDEARRQRGPDGRWLAAGASADTALANLKPAGTTAGGRQVAGLLADALGLDAGGAEAASADAHGDQGDALKIAADRLEDLGLDKTATAIRAVIDAARQSGPDIAAAQADRLNPVLAAAHRELAAAGVTVSVPNQNNAVGRNSVVVNDAGTGMVAYRRSGRLLAGAADSAAVKRGAEPGARGGKKPAGLHVGKDALAALSTAGLAALALDKAVAVADGNESRHGTLSRPWLLRGTQRKSDRTHSPNATDGATALDAVNNPSVWQPYHLGGKLRDQPALHNKDGTTTLTSNLMSGTRTDGTITAVQGRDGHEAVTVASNRTVQSGDQAVANLVGTAVAQAALRGAQAVELKVTRAMTRAGDGVLAGRLAVLVERGLATAVPQARSKSEARAGMEATHAVYQIHAPELAAHALLGSQLRNGDGVSDNDLDLHFTSSPGSTAAGAMAELGVTATHRAGAVLHAEYECRGGRRGDGTGVATAENVATLKQKPGTSEATLKLNTPTRPGGSSVADVGQRAEYARIAALAAALHEAHLKRITQVKIPAGKQRDWWHETMVRGGAAKYTRGSYVITDLPLARDLAESHLKNSLT